MRLAVSVNCAVDPLRDWFVFFHHFWLAGRMVVDFTQAIEEVVLVLALLVEHGRFG